MRSSASRVQRSSPIKLPRTVPPARLWPATARYRYLYLRWWNRPKPAPGDAGSRVCRLLALICLGFLVGHLCLCAYYFYAPQPVPHNGQIVTRGSIPVAIYGTDDSARCTVDGDQRTAPARGYRDDLTVAPALHLPADGMARQIDCSANARVVESRLVTLYPVIYRSWVLPAAWLFLAVSYARGWFGPFLQVWSPPPFANRG